MKVMIEKEKLLELMVDSLKLQALEEGGVDNWDWYGEAIEQFLDNEDAFDFYELAERLCK